MRKTKKELEVIKKKYNIDELWSWSKFNTYKTSPYEFFLKYILNIKEDRANSIYTYAGSCCHGILEDFYEKKISKNQLSDQFFERWFLLSRSNYKFDRTDETKNKNIELKYTENLKHFFKYHIPLCGKVEVEKFITIKIENYIFQGYIDAINVEENNIIITDFKTSTIYQGAKILKEAGQLVLYAEGIKQMGIPLEKIKCRWDFLKYCTVVQEQANGKKVERNIERNKIGESLQSNVKMWLKKCGYEKNISDYLALLLQTNSIECLPQDIQDKYELKDCFVYVPITEEIIENLKEDIVNTISEIKQKISSYNKLYDDRVFYDTEEQIKKESYYFSVLCGYSPILHKPWGDYCRRINENQDLFLVNSNSDINDCSEEDDISWLNDI